MSSDPAHHLASEEESYGQRVPGGIGPDGTYKFSCPECCQRIAAPVSVAGILVACPECAQTFLAPNIPAQSRFSPPAAEEPSSWKMGRKWLIIGSIAAVLAASAILMQHFGRNPLTSPAPTNAAVDPLAATRAATIEYWKALEEVINVKPEKPDMAQLVEKREFATLSNQWQRYAAQQRHVAADIRNLRTRDVDDTLVDYGLKMADHWSDAALFCDEGAQLAAGFGNFHSNYNSAAALAENFVRGALGDNPLNKMREGQVEMERLKEREAAWDSHGRELDRVKNTLLSESTRLRATLGRKYGIEF